MALAGWSTNEMLEGLDGVMALAAASGEDLGAVSDIVTDSLSAFQMEAKDSARFADVLAAASANANTDVSGLGAAFAYVAPVAGALGFTVEDTATAIGLMSNAGIKGEKSGTALRTMMTNLAKPTKAMKGEMERLGISLTNTDGTMKTFDEIMNELRVSFGGLDEAQSAASAATIFGKEAMSGALAIINTSEEDYNSLSDAIYGSEGAAQKMSDTMEGTLGGTLRQIKSGLEGFAISIYEEMLPALSEGAEKVKGLVSWLNDLPSGTKKGVLAFAAIAAAIGPVLVVGGTLIAGLGSIFTMIGTVSGAIAVMTTGVASAVPAVAGLAGIFTVLTGPIGLGIAALVGITAAGVGLYNHFKKDSIPEIDRFGDKVSETTKEALGNFFELSDGVGEAMADLTITTSQVTDEIAADMVGKFSEMNNQIMTGMNERHAKQLESMQSFFTDSSALTETEEAAILKKQQWRNETEVAAQQAREDRVIEILNKASTEKRKLTETEEIELNAIHTSMNNTAVKVLSESEVEQKIIMERMKQTAGDLSAKQAADVVKRSAEQRDGTIKAAEEEYEGRMAEIIRMRDETGDISEEQATKMIAEARKARDGTVNHAENMHADVVDEAKKQATGHLEQVNWETGEVLSKWEVYKNNVARKFRETNANSMADIKQFSRDFMSAVETTKNNAIAGWERYKSGMNTTLRRAGQDGLNSLGSMVNGIIKGINWILGKLNVKSIGFWAVPNILGQQSAGTQSGAPVKAYAHGTEGHPGGLALLGDGIGSNAGSELIRTPDGKVGLSPATNTLLDLPKGTSVLSATETKKLFSPVPKYANGIGDLFNAGKSKLFDIFDYIANPKKLLDVGLAAVGFKMPSIGGFMKDVLSGGFNKVKDGALNFIKSKLSIFEESAGGNGQGFGPAFRLTSARGWRFDPFTGKRTFHQGDDWGARSGTPIASQAAGQVVSSRFEKYRGNTVRVKSGIYEHLYQHNSRNLVSAGQAVRKGQTVGLVGSTGDSTGPHLHHELKKNGVNINPRGLATGGMTTGFTASTLHEEGYPEIVIPTAPKRRTDAMKLLALAAKKIQGGGENVVRPNQLPNVQGSDGGIMQKLLAATLEQNQLLMQLLNKNGDVYLDKHTLVGSIGPELDQYNGSGSSIHRTMKGLK